MKKSPQYVCLAFLTILLNGLFYLTKAAINKKESISLSANKIQILIHHLWKNEFLACVGCATGT